MSPRSLPPRLICHGAESHEARQGNRNSLGKGRLAACASTSAGLVRKECQDLLQGYQQLWTSQRMAGCTPSAGRHPYVQGRSPGYSALNGPQKTLILGFFYRLVRPNVWKKPGDPVKGPQKILIWLPIWTCKTKLIYDKEKPGGPRCLLLLCGDLRF